MALLPIYYNTTRMGGRSKVKKKPGWQAREQAHNAWLRENGVHPDQLKKRAKEFKPLQVSPEAKAREKQMKEFNEKYKSLSTEGKMSGNTFKKEPQKYTGTLVTGIAQMHKSNAVPVINKQQAIDVAKMRRG